MFKKFVSLAIVLMLVMSMAAVAVSAAQVEISENAADTPAEVGAEGGADTGAEGGADTGAGSRVIYFDPNGCGWNNYKEIMVYVYEPKTGDVLIDWAAKKAGGMVEENGVWKFDFDAPPKQKTPTPVALDAGKEYCIIFNTDTGVQTHDLLFNTSCLGDTAVGTSEKCENPADSNKQSNIANWKSGKLGPVKAITSIGNVVPDNGGVIPSHTTAYDMFVSFLADTGASGLQNALNFQTYKTAQQIIDTTAQKLGLYKGDVKKAIAEANGKENADGSKGPDWSKDWDESKSPLTDGENQEAHKNPDNPSGSSGGSGSGSDGSGSDSDGSGSDSDGSGSGSDGSGSGGSGSSGSGSSGSSGASGSGDGASTGQETTVLYIMLGVMVAAAGVIFFVRRKTRA